MSSVDILLATYNGATYLGELLASIERQSYSHWRLLVRDDGSSDHTLEVVRAFQERHPTQVRLLPSGERSGVTANFSALLCACDAPYAMCCDQDDVWDRDKIELSLNAIRKAEAELLPLTPVLVHTDLRVVDSSLRPLHTSFWRYAKLFPEKTLLLNRFLSQNVVTGCASICNRALIDCALPIPPEALIHDWWLALVGSALGKIVPLARTTLLYRQHGGNLIGAQRFGSFAHFKRARTQCKRLEIGKRAQAKVLLDRYRPRLSHAQIATLEAYLSLHRCNSLKSRYLALRHGFRKQGFLRQLLAFCTLKQP